MFNKTIASDKTFQGINLYFLKSSCIQAYPCGRRRSELVETHDKDGNGQVSAEEQYYFPFDPEARLNTESNNTKYSSLNGFTQTYLLDWNNEGSGKIKLALGGYLFSITPIGEEDTTLLNVSTFANKISSSASKIYANILLEETPLYTGFKDYRTNVLRNQSSDDSIMLDLYTDTGDRHNFENYYFSGLSFSADPLTEDSSKTRSTKYIAGQQNEQVTTYPQQVISLCILEKIEGIWQIHQPALLPQVEHGELEGSVKVETLIANKIIKNGIPVPSLYVAPVNGKYRLQFSTK
jgi:hypothetical protein